MKIIITGIFLLASLSINAQNGDKNFIDQNFIEVVGKSELEITPDNIFIKVLLNEKDTKNRISVSELESRMVEKLKGIGIDVSKDLLIKEISSNFKFYLLTKNDILLSKEYQVLVHDGKTASQVFLELEKAGISNVTLDRLENSKIEQYRKEVKITAIKAAKEKAESLALALNQNIGRALFIQELDNKMNDSRSSNILIRGISSKVYDLNASPMLDVDFEKIKIEYSILCRFELK